MVERVRHKGHAAWADCDSPWRPELITASSMRAFLVQVGAVGVEMLKTMVTGIGHIEASVGGEGDAGALCQAARNRGELPGQFLDLAFRGVPTTLNTLIAALRGSG